MNLSKKDGFYMMYIQNVAGNGQIKTNIKKMGGFSNEKNNVNSGGYEYSSSSW